MTSFDNTAILVQVCLHSKRCPGKALADLAGEPLIWRLTERVQQSGLPVIWCVRDCAEDEPLVDLALKHGVQVFTGADDPMKRLVDAAENFEVDTIVRVTGDNPLTDPNAIAMMVAYQRMTGALYVWTPDLARGLRAEVITTKHLSAVRENYPAADTEMTFSHLLKALANDESKLEMRNYYADGEACFTVDTKDQLERMQNIYECFDGQPPTNPYMYTDMINLHGNG